MNADDLGVKNLTKLIKKEFYLFLGIAMLIKMWNDLKATKQTLHSNSNDTVQCKS